jgi:hypothetical protein
MVNGRANYENSKDEHIKNRYQKSGIWQGEKQSTTTRTVRKNLKEQISEIRCKAGVKQSK